MKRTIRVVLGSTLAIVMTALLATNPAPMAYAVPPGADVAIVSTEVVDPPAEINVSEQIPITLRKEIINNGTAKLFFTL